MKKFSFEIKSTEMRIAEATLKKINHFEEEIQQLLINMKINILNIVHDKKQI